MRATDAIASLGCEIPPPLISGVTPDGTFGQPLGRPDCDSTR